MCNAERVLFYLQGVAVTLASEYNKLVYRTGCFARVYQFIFWNFFSVSELEIWFELYIRTTYMISDYRAPIFFVPFERAAMFVYGFG